ncbi:MAG TPA: protein kinase [Myxococcus sp.]|nr:protein kinase [Myxococcus sp.]
MSSPQSAIPFGKYVLIKRLAVGGMAELFLAQCPPDPELVVIKRILPYLSEEPEFVQMFLDEARIAAQLHHPNIVQVHELGHWGDNIFIAMEYVEGVDLRRVVAEEAKHGAVVPCGVAARICAQVAAGLDYAHHSRGVDGRPLELIHRDVSPQNVMIAYDGRIKLVDFGIAKAGAFMERSKPGVIKGKFLYLAPEQVSQERLDHRADIFALGTMLYEITTGKQPFNRPTTEGILYAIRNEDPSPPHLLRDDYPEGLSRIIMRCLTKDRSQRYQRASAVRADLDAFLASGALKQSLDVSEYVARLLGAEEERTVLHIPSARGVARRDATVSLPGRASTQDGPLRRPSLMDATSPTLSSTTPAGEPSISGAQLTPGLTARPTPRRSSAEAPLLAPAFADEPEPATQMARPAELPTGIDDDADASEVSTAINTAPNDYRTEALARELAEVARGESTVPQRGRHREERSRVASAPPVPTSPPVRRSNSFVEPPPPPRASGSQEPARSRRVSPPPAPLAVPRRTPHPEDDDEGSASVSLTPPLPRRTPHPEDEEGSQSVSLTPPTLNQRAVSRSVMPAPRLAVQDMEEDDFPADDGLSSVDITAPTSASRRDPDDDESTAGYDGSLDGEDYPPTTTQRKRPGALLAIGGGALLLALGSGVVWALRPAPFVPPPPDLSQTAAAAEADAGPAPEAAPPAADDTLAHLAIPVAGEAVDAADAGDVADAGDDALAALPQATGAADAGVAGAEGDAGTPAPALVAVRFEAPSRTVLVRLETGERLPVNKVISLPAGALRVRVDCPGRRPLPSTKSYRVGPAGTEPLVLRVPCKPRR